MGLGGYLPGRTEIELYDSEERREYEEVVSKHEVKLPRRKKFLLNTE